MCYFCLYFPQSLAWTSSGNWSVGLKVPFSVHVTKATFEQLDDLLQRVCEGLDGPSDWPPPQEKECMAVAGLNLLRLQVGSHGFHITLLLLVVMKSITFSSKVENFEEKNVFISEGFKICWSVLYSIIQIGE